MQNVVYVLGAGFSAPLGIPTMSDFWLKGSQLLTSNPEKYGFIRDVLKLINSTSVAGQHFNHNVRNIEDVLSMLQITSGVDNSAGDLVKYKKFVQEVIVSCSPVDIPMSSAKEYSDSRWTQKLFTEEMPIQYYFYFIASLFKLNIVKRNYIVDYGNRQNNRIDGVEFSPDLYRTTRYDIISFNYDLVLENIVEQINKHLVSQDGTMLKFNYQSNPRLIKLHGSIDNLDSIVLPTFNKGIFIDQLPDQWKSAYHLLAEANEIRFIGYSLPESDSYIKYLLKAALSNNDAMGLQAIHILCKNDDYGKKIVSKRYSDFFSDDIQFAMGDTASYLAENWGLQSQAHQNQDNLLVFEHLERAHENYFRKNVHSF